MNDTEHYLKDLGLSPSEIRAYVALTKLGEAPASQVAKAAGMPRTTAISILEKLKEDNLVSSHKYRGRYFYWIESPDVFVESLLSRAEVAKEMSLSLKDLYRADGTFPATEIYDSQKGIRSFIEKLLGSLKTGSVIYTIESPGKGNYSKIYPEKIEKTILLQKKKKRINTLSLIPNGSYKLIDNFKLDSQDITIKELPAGFDFSSSVWLVGDKLVHFSGNPPYIAAIRHEKIVESMKNLFDFLWSISKPCK
ncbi:MAG: hypothetical protein A3J46_00575 [Candidatus Yanofskybacteria bacterium RIFCSPHIGHO2_02_FULL_41_11]|uniref:Transcription regulator TrmB N-terminal domain-containing protein n=1 Tax=Candidatus Yanofskybacteria bacterium RIFCSPHIGHO2_02_FULL_41_11 TaxID=1802675 RepID=A0A1F8FCK7_9BACT|nr:MAG: hypothetical protein A3J46_00575 [Candidatus Yanofskybacteria bacterium RIFCSPHIGHO2_02_FULL_41_11]